MITKGDNFRLVTGEEARESLEAYFGAMTLSDAPIHVTPMPRPPRPENDCKPWAPYDDLLLKEMLREGWSDKNAGTALGRTPEAIRNRRSFLNLKRVQGR